MTRRTIAPVFGLLLLSTVAAAEGISGLITDEQKAVLPGVSITVENMETGVKREVVTSAAGRYDATNLPPGRYAINASLSGFATVVRRGVTLTVGQDVVVDLVLPLGKVTDEIVVVGEAPLVDTTSATVSGLVDERAIRDLPLVSRSWDELITLQAGTAVFRRVNPSVQTGNTAHFTVSGQRPTSNKFYQDGTELGGAQGINDLPGSTAGVNLGVEGIREFRVLTSSYSPEYGKKAGGAIITVTKSGTNAFRGSLFDFYRNDAFDAPNYFAVGEKDAFTRNNFGGSVGGPILRNRSFFFANYEGLRERLSAPVSKIVPNEAARQGFLPGPGGTVQFVGVSPNVQPFFNLWPLPNGRDFGDGSAAYDFAPKRTSREDYVLGKFDHQFSGSNSLFVSYTVSDADQTEPAALGPFFNTSNLSRQQRATVEHKWIASPQLLYTFRFGYNRAYHDTGPRQVADLSVPEFTPRRGIGGLEVGGLDSGGTGSTGVRFALKNHFQLSTQASYVRGKHTFEFGGQLQRVHFDENHQTSVAGNWDFAGLREFLLGQPLRFEGFLPEDATGTLRIGLAPDITTEKGWRQTYGALYLRDRIRWTANLSLDLGLRYEVLSSPTEIHGRSGNFPVVDIIPPFNYVLGNTPVVGKKIYPTRYRAGLGPRIGMAWDPFGRGRTSVQAGVGVFYDQIENEYRWYWRTNPPFEASIDLRNPASALFPSPWAAVDLSNAVISARAIDANIDVPTMIHYNVAVEQQVGSAASFKVGYVGSASRNILIGNQANLRVPQVVDGQLFWPSASAPFAQPSLARVNFLTSGGTGRYDALQAEFQTRFANGGLFRRLRSKFAYTFSKNVDDFSQIQTSAAQGSRGALTNPLDVRGDRGLSAQHIAHMFSFNFTFDLHDLPLHGFMGAVLNHWQLSGIVTLTTGMPVNIITGFNRSRSGHDARIDRPNLIAGGNDNPVIGGPERYFDPSQFALPPAGYLGDLGANTLIGPGLATLDFSLARNFPVAAVSERFNVQFRAEIFNLLNRANFSLPDARVFNSNGTVRGAAGLITNTSTPNRQMQLGLRLEF